MRKPQIDLVGDIGGTNSRFALVREGSFEPEAVLSLKNDDFLFFEEAVRAYIREQSLRPERAVFAVAGPVRGHQVQLTNRNWLIDAEVLTANLGFERTLLINDFSAQAYALLGLRDHHLSPLGREGVARAGAPKLVLGPGTGLGVGLMVPRPEGGGIAIATEGGHVELAACNEREWLVRQKMIADFGRCSAELILCGSGLVRLYHCLVSLDGGKALYSKPGDLISAAVEDRQAEETLSLFCCWLGRLAGDLALATGAEGGVYLTGGVTSHMAERLDKGDFRQAFTSKGGHSAYTQAIPTWRICAREPGLIGAAVALAMMEDRLEKVPYG